ncbi:hypothetical protein PENSPDRAFT_672244 [Peniophora sp. CONT]|nr:hypothetical protein PENSPDRAFT_672244 [Peniophora sp. CONT]
MSGLPDYAKEKRKKVAKEPHKITELFDTKTVVFIAKFGWNNLFRTLTEVVREATDKARAATQGEANAAHAAVKGGSGSTDTDKFAEQQRKDDIVKAVRGKYTKLYQRVLREGVPGATKLSIDVVKLIKSIMAKPSQRQLYLVWAKLRTRPDLEHKVDKQHAAALESKDEKVITRREALKLLDIEMKSWEDQAVSNPSSPAEARVFIERSEELLRAMMQFFANHVSGIAIMFLAGPKKVSLSEAVCEMPGQPKVLYSQVAEEETTLRLMGSRVLSQSCLINGAFIGVDSEMKWGVLLNDDEDKEDQPESIPMDVDSILDPAPQQTKSQTTLAAEDVVPSIVTVQAVTMTDGIEGHPRQVRGSPHRIEAALIVLTG